MSKRWIGNGLLLLGAMIWGAAFVAQSVGMDYLEPFTFQASRCFLGSLVLLPVIAGVSYEIIRLAGNSDNPVVSLFSKPGLALQRLTTREPEEDMVEVAIRAVEAVFDWREYLRENFPGTQVLPEEEKEAVQ